MTRHIGGFVTTAAGALPYATAQARYDTFSRIAAETAEAFPDLARDFAREAIDLHNALRECARYRRAAGWMRPEDADVRVAR